MITPVTKPDPNYVRIFDTTLRDGEQSPGATMTSAEKLEVARALARLGVDAIEAGFPAAAPGGVGALRRASRGDIDKGWEAVKTAARPRIHTFLATSELHMKHKLRMEPNDVLA